MDLGAVEDGSEDVVRERKTVMDPGIVHESDLVHAFVNNITIFDRSAASRRSPQRAQLRKATGMTDEQLEGWSIMFSRNVSVKLLNEAMASTKVYSFVFHHSRESRGYWINTPCGMANNQKCRTHLQLQSKMIAILDHQEHQPKNATIRIRTRQRLQTIVERRCMIRRSEGQCLLLAKRFITVIANVTLTHLNV